MTRQPSTTTIRAGQPHIYKGTLCFAYATFKSADAAYEAEENMYADGEISSYEHVGTVRVGNRWAILLRAQ